MAENKGFFSRLFGSLFGKDRLYQPPPAGAVKAPAAEAQKAPAANPEVRQPSAAAQPDRADQSQADQRRIYTGEVPLIRQLYLWGRDSAGNPGFLVLYGDHGSTSHQGAQLLDESVTYTHGYILRGSGGHFPSFEPLAVRDSMNYKTRETTRHLYYKKDVRNRYWADPNDAVPGLIQVPQDGVAIPYYGEQSYAERAALVKARHIPLPDFALADQPGDLLELGAELSPYLDILIPLLSHPGIYLRKKSLRTLIDRNPPRPLWQYLLRIGSTELIAGIFLELALRKNPLLLEEAKAAVDSPHAWAAASYAAGIRRTARLYLNAFDENVREERLEFLRETLPGLQFYPVKIGERELPPDQRPEGAVLRKYALQGCLAEFYYSYSYEERRSHKVRREGIYPESYYCDTVALDRIRLKNTLQESEIYGAADIIGHLAYYLDAPGLIYYFQANSLSRAKNYFHRYIIRILNSYAETDEAKFMEAMVQLLTGYAPEDYCCKYPGNFQFNHFIKYYLYHSFDNTPPEGWQERCLFMSGDQLRKLEGRFEYRPEIWNRHLDRVVDIALGARVETIQKAVLYILKDPANTAALEALSYQRLSALASSSYEPLAELGASLIGARLQAETGFRAETMTLLMRCENPAVRELARQYFQRSGGAFVPEELAGLLLLPDLESWEAMLSENIGSLDGTGYIRFLRALFDAAPGFAAAGVSWEGPLTELLDVTLGNLQKASREEVSALLADILHRIPAADAALLDFMGKVVFSLPLEELRALAGGLTIPPGNSLIAVLLEAVRSDTVPSDSAIAALLLEGSSPMVRTLTELLSAGISQLGGRFSTVLLLLESDVPALHETAKEVFEGLAGGERQKLHTVILDSPHPHAYGYGLEQLRRLYESRDQLIPEPLIRRMLEHSSGEVKNFMAAKIQDVLSTLGGGDAALFLYYVRTLLYLPNRLSGGKDRVYAVLPRFVREHAGAWDEVEALLLEIGGSNIIKDSERALVALAHMRREAVR